MVIGDGKVLIVQEANPSYRGTSWNCQYIGKKHVLRTLEQVFWYVSQLSSILGNREATWPALLKFQL